MTTTCDCGRVSIFREDDRVVIAAQDTTALVSIHKDLDDRDVVKVQHLECGMCVRERVPDGG